MLSSSEFIQQSLELHLFFARIMKEHSFFLEVSFTTKDLDYIDEANAFRMEFDILLADTISISNGVVSNDVLESGEVVTPFTLKAEMASAYFTGVKIPFDFTKVETGLSGGTLNMDNNKRLEQKVFILNNRAMELIKGLAQFKTKLLSDVMGLSH